MKLFLLTAFIFFLKAGFAQSNTGELNNTTASVIVHKDLRVDMLMQKQADINMAVKRATGYTTKGYRLMIIHTNKRDEAIDAKTKVYTYFPELKAYLLYQAPYFKLKAGNFKTREEAEKYRRNMNNMFPKGVFIISDVIEVRPEKDPFDE